jgi:hypothetical protein
VFLICAVTVRVWPHAAGAGVTTNEVPSRFDGCCGVIWRIDVSYPSPTPRLLFVLVSLMPPLGFTQAPM